MRIRNILAACAVAVSTAMSAQTAATADSLSMAVGTAFGHDIGVQLDRLRSLGLNVDVDVFMQSMAAQLRGSDTGFTPAEANAWLDRYIASTRPDDLPDVLSAESQQAFLDSIASLPGAVRYPDGLIMIVELEGEGAMPTDSDVVKVMYTGRFYNGTQFDSTSTPIEFGVNQVTPGFSEGLKLMRPGGRYRIVMPASLAYGEEGIPGAVPGNAALDFTVNLVGIRP